MQDIRAMVERVVRGGDPSTAVSRILESADTDLTKWAVRAAEVVRHDPPYERAMFVAVTVGKHAKRLGMSERNVTRWLQSAYSSVWVKEFYLNPGADMKQVRDQVLKAMK